jgi:hypothetical protein
MYQSGNHKYRKVRKCNLIEKIIKNIILNTDTIVQILLTPVRMISKPAEFIS